MSDEKTWPHQELGKKLSNWGRWGADDEIGTLNLVTPEKVAAAAKLARTGKRIDLGMSFDKNGPQDGGFRINPVHTMTWTPLDTAGLPDGMISADDMVVMGLQCATQWDALSHVGYGGFFYNGVPSTAVRPGAGATRNSFAAANGHLISRGVLLDLPAVKGVDRLPDSHEITSTDLEEAEAAHGVTVEPGDVLCLRTGWYQYFLEGDKTKFGRGPEPGPGLEVLQWFKDRDIAAIAIDNWAFERYPTVVEGSVIPVHQIAIRDLGLTIGEMFTFEDLAADCAADGVYEFLFTGTGLKISNSVGSPVSPIAIK
ncbi:cyclase [Amycolatopsis sp. NBRC 101858]|uniref:cyclase family protein n=1 Tax=Amycolatopsis sp. NBRC 101858 TaxID=3032200 RepID=UPI0024A3E6BB|nr:cyclase family protein [Amycolatopsis sp. NBRC 101858]GLY38943.1 cyclase [Amycolatopsis sp. NBRC 101858]